MPADDKLNIYELLGLASTMIQTLRAQTPLLAHDPGQLEIEEIIERRAGPELLSIDLVQ